MSPGPITKHQHLKGAPKAPPGTHFHVLVDGREALVAVCDKRDTGRFAHQHLNLRDYSRSVTLRGASDRTVARAAHKAVRRWSRDRSILERAAALTPTLHTA